MAMRVQADNTVEGMVSSLYGAIMREVSSCRKLLDLSKAEQKFLMENDVESLSANTGEIREIVLKLKSNQKKRKELMSKIGVELDLQPEELSLINIGELIKPELSKRLQEAGKKLLEVGEKLYRSNHNTIYMVKFSLDLLQQQSKMWAELAAEEEVYGQGGEQSENEVDPLFVQEKV